MKVIVKEKIKSRKFKRKLYSERELSLSLHLLQISNMIFVFLGSVIFFEKKKNTYKISLHFQPLVLGCETWAFCLLMNRLV